MSIELNDPRLTAFALGELDAAEHEVVAREIAQSADAQAAVDDIRATAAMLEAELGAEPSERLTETQRAALATAAQDNGVPRRRGPVDWRFTRYGSLLAACLVIGVGLTVFATRDGVDERGRVTRLAENTPQQGGTRGLPEGESQRKGGVSRELAATDEPLALADGRREEAVLPPALAEAMEPIAASEETDSVLIDGSEESIERVQLALRAMKDDGERLRKFRSPSTAAPTAAGNAGTPVDGDAATARLDVTAGRPAAHATTSQRLERGGTNREGHGLFGGDDGSGRRYFDAYDDAASHEPGSWIEWLDAKPVLLPGLSPAQALKLLEDLNRAPADRQYFKKEIPPAVLRQLEQALSRIAFATGPVDPSNEDYARVHDNPFQRVVDAPLSTFSIDVDTASYANMRRFIVGGQLPQPDAVRIEELVNYFSYDYAGPDGDAPFAANVEVAACPWSMGHRLVRIGLKGREMTGPRPAANFVFLIDVSGSMQPANKLPLLKESMRLLVEQLTGADRVAIVTYAGNAGLVLPSTTANNRETLLHAIDNLGAGGSTNGAAGIQLAYNEAEEHLIKGGINRVILATDGDFNVGITHQDELHRLIRDQARSGVFLSVLGFGMGNLKDATLELLADKGNGNYAYIDTLNEARKVLVEQMQSTLVTIAKDVKIQVEFNPAEVAAYRLIGYENRMLAAEDFNDDRKDAGEIGAGHTVTALYEIVPAGLGGQWTRPAMDDLKYQQPEVVEAPPALSDAAGSGELLTLKLRYKAPEEDTSELLEFPVRDGGAAFGEASADFRFAASVASFGMLLRHSPYRGDWSFNTIAETASASRGGDPFGYRAEFVELVRSARKIQLGE